jgi:3alpha(or 20beta)-hydroxysteroid dehydrogenase
MSRLTGKVALVTGAARGQGAAEAQLFLDQGATVWLTDVLDELGEATAENLGPKAHYRHLDVTDPEQWRAVVSEIVDTHGRCDVLVNNAGVFELGSLDSTTLEAWNHTIAINQTGVFLGMQAVAAPMRAAGSGSIINISSIAGLQGAAMAQAYSASKWAVRGMTKSAAAELTPHGVRVNSVHPGLIETAMLEGFGELRATITERIPIGRTAEADEVASLVLFLASDESSYCSGHEFVIDGGFTL